MHDPLGMDIGDAFENALHQPTDLLLGILLVLIQAILKVSAGEHFKHKVDVLMGFKNLMELNNVPVSWCPSHACDLVCDRILCS